MNALSKALRELRQAIRGQDLAPIISNEDLRTAADMLGVLANIAEGMDMGKAFGAPGDWGYDTPIGSALIIGFKSREWPPKPKQPPDTERLISTLRKFHAEFEGDGVQLGTLAEVRVLISELDA